MTKVACLYAIVRFAPFIETGEFANVGAVMLAPNARFFEYKLMYRRYARVTQFFEQLDPKIFRDTMEALRSELMRLGTLLKQNGFDKRMKACNVDLANQLFRELTRTRETIIKFSEIRGVLAEDPQAKLNELYGHYVERSFATKEYQETVLERGIRRWLSEIKIADRFQRHEVGNDDYEVVFPFVELRDGVPTKVIKPLHLAHPEPSRIINHGGDWIQRVRNLGRRGTLPQDVLFTIGVPKDEQNFDARTRACNDVIAELNEVGVQAVTIDQKQAILQFAGRENFQ